MGFKIIFSPQALDDLARIVRRISKSDQHAAERVGHALIDRVLILQDFPLLGSVVPKRPAIRKLVLRPYLIYYRATVDDRIDILRYWHGARRQPELPE
jgi:addiction module RelE/StbE family toxin